VTMPSRCPFAACDYADQPLHLLGVLCCAALPCQAADRPSAWGWAVDDAEPLRLPPAALGLLSQVRPENSTPWACLDWQLLPRPAKVFPAAELPHFASRLALSSCW
jgi:hypothetical protein